MKSPTSTRPSRVDRSLSAQEFYKSLTGNAGVKPDLSKITISPSGQVQPVDSQQSQSPQTENPQAAESTGTD